jgi:hypothetical protein
MCLALSWIVPIWQVDELVIMSDFLMFYAYGGFGFAA